MCDVERASMDVYCPDACGACLATGPPASPAPRTSPAEFGTQQHDWCGDPWDDRRIADRGYWVWRAAVPDGELSSMKAYVNGLNNRGALCGEPYNQQAPCRFDAAKLRALFPATYQAVNDKIRAWKQGGFSDTAFLGWPLDVQGGEFIATNRWRLELNSSCHLAAVFDATAQERQACLNQAYPNGQYTSLDTGWQLCAHEALMSDGIRERIRATVASTEADARCDAGRYAVLDGPIDYVQGPGREIIDRLGVRRRIRTLASIRAVVHRALDGDTGFYNGYHDWHVDGPATYGREHKMYVLVAKGGVSNLSRVHSNLRVVPSYGQSWYWEHQTRPCWDPPEVRGCNASFCDEYGWNASRCVTRTKEDHIFSEVGRDQLTSWHVPDDWAGIDRLACDVPLDPGDVLFWREDVWHRTQDLKFDRRALRIDIRRLPFEAGGGFHAINYDADQLYGS